MDISLTLAFTIIICTTVSCFTAIMWQMMKHLINQNTIQQATQSSNINLNKQHNFNKTNRKRKIKSFMHPLWIYKETTTTTNNPTDADSESVKNESASNTSIGNKSADNESTDSKSAKK